MHMDMHLSKLITLAGLVVGLTCVACSDRGKGAALPGDDKVLVQVNGTEITQYDVDRTAREVLGEATAARIDEATQKKVLESIVQRRAIAQARDKELKPEQRAELDKQVAAFREEQLVKQYLLEHTAQGDVTDDMVREYYEQHRERFGGRRVRSYELITSSGPLAPAQRSALITSLSQAEREQDWQAFAGRLRQSGQPLALRSGQSDESVLHPRLKQLIDQLAVGQTSKVTLIEGAPYAVRVTAEREVPPKPLAEVSDQIRKTLGPVKLKAAVEQASQQVIKNADVAYR
jgi:PPIC-type PPIASE domain